MFASEALSVWLGDRDRQARSRVAVQSFVDAWSGSPLMGGLHRELEAMIDPRPEQLLTTARAFLDRAGDLDALMQALLARCRADPFFIPPMHPLTSEIHNGLLLVHHKYLQIGMGVTGVDMLAAKKAKRNGPASIGFTGLWTLFRYVKSGGATISFWETDPIGPDFSAAEAGALRMTGRRRISDGDEIVIDGSRQSFIVDHATSDMLYLQAVVRTGAAPLTAEYDSDSRAFIGATSTDEASSRVQMMATLLREMGRDDAVPVLRESLRNPHFYTRWHVMRELLALDAEAVLPDLRRMAEADPHPEVRAAAAQTLELFFHSETDEREEEPCLV